MQDNGQQKPHHERPGRKKHICERHQLPRIVFCLRVITSSDGLRHDGHHRHAKDISRNALDRNDRPGNCVRCDRDRPERRHQGEQHNFADLEDSVFQAVRYPDTKDFADQCQVKMVPPGVIYRQQILRPQQQPQHQYAAKCPGNKRWHCDSGDTSIQNKDTDRIPRNIQDAHQQCVKSNQLRIPCAAENRRRGIVHSHKRHRKIDNQEIRACRLVNLRLDPSEDHIQYETSENKQNDSDNTAKKNVAPHKLCGRFLRHFSVSVTNILPRHNRAAGGERAENHQNEEKNVVHQRDAGYRRFSHCRHHDRVCQSDCHVQKQFCDHRQNHDKKCSVVEQQAVMRRPQPEYLHIFPPISSL